MKASKCCAAGAWGVIWSVGKVPRVAGKDPVAVPDDRRGKNMMVVVTGKVASGDKHSVSGDQRLVRYTRFHSLASRETVLRAAVMRPMETETGPTGRKPARREIELSGEDCERLEQITGNPLSLQRRVWRADIILEPGSGRGLAGTMRRTGMSMPTVWHWH